MSKGQDAYAVSLRAAARGLWLGALTRAEFGDAFGTALDKYLRRAFDEGMAQYGIEPENYTDDDLDAFQNFLLNQYRYLPGLEDFIVEQSKANGGSLDVVLVRVAMWVNRYEEVADLARMRAGSDEKLMWQMGRTEHCDSCYALAGWVKRGSYWQKFYAETGLRPKSERLKCHGFKCECKLRPTRAAISKGRPPAVI